MRQGDREASESQANAPDLRQQAATRHWVTLRGLGSLGQGQQVNLHLGAVIIAGRSRHCDWSLRRTPRFLMSDAAGRKALRAQLEFTSVSRRHVRLRYVAPDQLEIENLSGNGTYVDGVPIEHLVLTDIRTKAHHLRLGPAGVELELRPGSLPL
ncbi:MAG: FHA domain-containing protein [Planctomycetota bacterium]|nr:FHA domain-containing protein [Planctomycetota bacterium]